MFINTIAQVWTEVSEKLSQLIKARDWYELAKNISNLWAETQNQNDTIRYEYFNSATAERIIAVYFKGWLEQINIISTDIHGFETSKKIFFQTLLQKSSIGETGHPEQIQLKKTLWAKNPETTRDWLKFWITAIQEFNNDWSSKILTNHGRGKTSTALYIQSSGNWEIGNQSIVYFGKPNTLGQSLDKELHIHYLTLAKGHTVVIQGNTVKIGVGESYTCTLEVPDNLDFSEYLLEIPSNTNTKRLSSQVQRQSGKLLNSFT